MVGDSVDDMTAGRLAGAVTVLLMNESNSHLAEHLHTDLVIENLDDLVGILEGGFEGRILDNSEVPVPALS
jgi:phosphoglycolate phosphatase-like HAD superfamily hydrolase